MIYVLSFLLLIVSGIAGVSIYGNVKLARKVFTIEDQTNHSLDILDNVYSRLSHASTIPVMHDEPVIKQVVNDIKEARDAVLLIANKISSGFSQSDEDAEGEDA